MFAIGFSDMCDVDKVANVDHVITTKNNPLAREWDGFAKASPYAAMNMEILRRDAKLRASSPHGKVYSGIMDNMRYGGNE